MGKYGKVFSVSLQNNIEYKFNFISQLVFSFIPFATNLLLWVVLYDSNPKNLGMTLKEMIVYYCFILVIENLVYNDLHQVVAGHIKDGDLSRFLITPCNYHLYQIFRAFAKNMMYLGFFALPVIIFSVVLNQKYHFGIDWVTWLLFLLALVIASVINILINLIIGTIAFFMTEVRCLFISMDILKGLLIGKVFPISLMPKVLYGFLVHTPFQFICYFPAMILLGKYNTAELLSNFLMSIGWIVVMLGMSSILWKIGLTKYSAVGG